jgi:hypothetical protein
MKTFALICMLVLAPLLTLGATSEQASTELPSGQLTRIPENPLVRNGPESYDYWKTGPRAVLKEGPTSYRMWYEAVGQDNITRVGYAVSSDGVNWTKKGVVMSPTASWERDEVSPNSVLFEDGVYKMWFHAGGYLYQGKRLGNGEIGYATSPDGLRWTKHAANPVIRIGPAGAFDDQQAAEPRVIRMDAGYRMYYTGQNRTTLAKSLAMATSADGINWTKDSRNPILRPERWGGWGGAFIFTAGIWNLWHARYDDVSGLEYKWSVDGVSWNDGPANPVLRLSRDLNTADAQAAGDSVSGYLDGDFFRIMYTGFNSNFRGTGRVEAICLATIDAPAVDGAPGQPTVTSAISGGDILTVSWVAGAGPSPTAHRLDFYSGAALVTQVNAGSGTSLAIPIPSGIQGTFGVQVTALNGTVAGPASALFTFSIGPACTLPASPNVSGGVVGGTASVSWPAVPGATSYILSVGTTAGGTQYLPPTNIGASTGASASGLPAGFTAWVRVLAVNACGQQSGPTDFFVQ